MGVEVSEVREKKDPNISFDPWSVGDAHGLVDTIVTGTTAGDLPGAIKKLMKTCELVPHICLGATKSKILSNAVHLRLQETSPPPPQGGLDVLELGAHSGDGTLHLLKHLPTGSSVVSVETDETEMDEGAKLIRHAIKGLGIDYYPFTMNKDESFDDFLKALIKDFNIGGFDIVMFDQRPPTRFRPYLDILIETKMLNIGAKIIADNIKHHGSMVEDYVKRIKGKEFETNFKKIPPPHSDIMSVSSYKGQHHDGEL